MFKRKSILSLLAIAFIGIAAVISPVPAGADSAGGLLLTVVPSTVTASPGDNVSFSYVITNTYNTAVSSLELTDNEFGPVALPVTSLAAGENVNVSLVHTVVVADLPGPLVSSATVTGLAADNTSLSATASASVTLEAPAPTEPGGDVTPPSDNRTKADILLERGVPGKGILHAPGLQKPFNWNFLGWGRSTENKIQHHDNNNDNDNDNNIGGGQGKGNGNGHSKNKGK